VEPDATSFFVVAETGWQFGALTISSPVQFEVPNRSGEVVHLTGARPTRTMWNARRRYPRLRDGQIGGGGRATPRFPDAIFRAGAGPARRNGGTERVSFTDLTNTQTISAATLTMYYWDELQGTPAIEPGQRHRTGDTLLSLSAAGPGGTRNLYSD